MTPTQAKAREEAEKVLSKYRESYVLSAENSHRLTEAIESALLTHLDRIQKLEEGLKAFVPRGGPGLESDYSWYVKASDCRTADALLKEGK